MSRYLFILAWSYGYPVVVQLFYDNYQLLPIYEETPGMFCLHVLCKAALKQSVWYRSHINKGDLTFYKLAKV